MFRFLFITVCLVFFRTGYAEHGKTGFSWPGNGPPVLFEIKGLGNGYSSPAVTGDRLYITGESDSTGYLFAFDLDGKLLWKTSYGEEWTIQFPGPHSDPAVVNDLIYISSGTGNIICFQTDNGKKVWSVSLINDLGGINPTFGYSMPLVFDGDKLFCSPGGETNNVVALNRFTGKLIWSSPAKGETAGYGSPLLITLPVRKILVTASEFNIMGFDAGNGELLWTYELTFKGEVPCNTPLFDGTNLTWIAGPGNGAVAAQLSPDGKEIHVLWKNIGFDTFFGDFVRNGDYLFGSSNALHNYVSVDARTGKISDSLSFGIGSAILAGKMLIAYNQKGQVGLIRCDREKMALVSSFRVSKGTKEHFSHPVYSGGKLYIRHGDVLLAYTIHSGEEN